MDPLSLAGAFATIVGLLSNFKAERTSSDLPSFIEWLLEHQQKELGNAITANQALSLELTSLLGVNHSELVSRLGQLNERLSAVAQTVEGFGSIANTLTPRNAISPQASSILKQMAESKAKYVMEHKRHPEPVFLFIDGAVGELQFSEPRFAEDDLKALVEVGFLRVELASKGSRKFFVTRSGSEAATVNAG